MHKIEICKNILSAFEKGKPFLFKQLVFNYNFSKFEANRSITSMLEYASVILADATANFDHDIGYVGKVLIRTPQNYPISNGFWVFNLALFLQCDIHWLFPGNSSELVNWLNHLVGKFKYNNEIIFKNENESCDQLEIENFCPELFTFIGSSCRFNEVKRVTSIRRMKLIGETGGNNIAICGKNTDLKKLIEEVSIQLYRHWGQNCNSVRTIYVSLSDYDVFVKQLQKELYQDYSAITPTGFVNKNYKHRYFNFIETAKTYCKNIISISDIVKLIEVGKEQTLHLFKEEWMGPAIAVIPYEETNEIQSILKLVEVFSISFWGKFQDNFTTKLINNANFPMHSFDNLVTSDPNRPWYGGNKTGDGFLLGKQFIQQFQKKSNDIINEDKKVLSEEVISSYLG